MASNEAGNPVITDWWWPGGVVGCIGLKDGICSIFDKNTPYRKP